MFQCFLPESPVLPALGSECFSDLPFSGLPCLLWNLYRYEVQESLGGFGDLRKHPEPFLLSLLKEINQMKTIRRKEGGGR